MVKHTQIIRRLLPTNCFSLFEYFVGLALKGLKYTLKHVLKTKCSEAKVYGEL